MMEGDLYQILWLTEKELDELMQSSLADVATFPHFATIDTKNGMVRFWPKIDPAKYVLFARQFKA